MEEKNINLNNQKIKKSIFKRLLRYCRPYLGKMLLATVMVLAITGLELFKPVILGDVVDMFIEETQFSSILYKGLVYVGLLFGLFGLNIAEMWILQSTGQKILFDIRNELMEHIYSLSLSYFDVTPVGQLVTRVTNDVEAINEMFSGILVQLVKNAAKIIGLGVVMLLLNVRLALRAFLLVPIIVVMTFLFKRVSRTCYRITRTKISELNIYLSEHLSGMKLIRVFARERVKRDEFHEKSNNLYQANFREIMVYAIFRPLIYILSIVALVNVIFGGSDMVFAENSIPGMGITVGTLYIFIQYVSSFFEPIQELAEQLGTLQQAIASAEKIFRILDVDSKIKNAEDAVRLLDADKPDVSASDRKNDGEKDKKTVVFRGKLEFRNVWFAYNDEDWILKDVSFVINPGERVAFVGATGAGKTTILSLVGRYYEINRGEILLDDVNIKDIDKDDLRRHIGQVQQDVFVFTGNIRDNITLQEESITDEQVIRAAQMVNADRFISKLEKSYDEPVTERGSTLSAGERQLLSFARTLAFNPGILVMDEATANIDTETEQLIQDALAKMMNGRTTIVVAHRLSTIQHCDCIMVMHHGKLREKGTHQQLLELGGIYKKLYEIQAT